MSSWFESGEDQGFGLDNLPYGVFSTEGDEPRLGVRVGQQVLDLRAVAADDAAGCPADLVEALSAPDLKVLLDAGPAAWAAARAWVRGLFDDSAMQDVVRRNLIDLGTVSMHLPVTVADYVDFYASEHHASNVGRIFRPNSPALPVNWKHLPIGYHGRAGTVVVSDTEILRPTGQRKAPDQDSPTFGPSIRLDIEVELGFIVGGGTQVGSSVPVGQAEDHIFGVVILNDWSARDIQSWEYVPLGPFLGKSFATSISAWVVPMAALQQARVDLPEQDPRPLPYLSETATQGMDIHLEFDLNGTVLTRPEYRDMYWSPAQMVAHMTVNGASLRSGDLFGSGTISGPSQETLGSLLELTINATEPVKLDDGSSRGFLEDGDTVTLRAWAPGPDGARIEFGEVRGKILPAS